MKCISCGSKLEAKDSFCSKCGMKRSELTGKFYALEQLKKHNKIKCFNCGKVLSKKEFEARKVAERFCCTRCGQNLLVDLKEVQALKGFKKKGFDLTTL